MEALTDDVLRGVREVHEENLRKSNSLDRQQYINGMRALREYERKFSFRFGDPIDKALGFPSDGNAALLAWADMATVLRLPALSVRPAGRTLTVTMLSLNGFTEVRTDELGVPYQSRKAMQTEILRTTSKVPFHRLCQTLVHWPQLAAGVEEVTMRVVMDREDHDDYEEFTYDEDDEPVYPSDIEDILNDDADDEDDEDEWRVVGQLNVKLNESLDLSAYTTFGEKVQMQVGVRDRKARVTTLSDPRAVMSWGTVKTCFACGNKDPKMRKCAACAPAGKDVYYCDSQCQRKDWKRHRDTCGTRSSNQPTPIR
jgi:hypothetical protein